MKRSTLIMLIFTATILVGGFWILKYYENYKKIEPIKIVKEKLNKNFENFSFFSLEKEYIIFSQGDKSYYYNIKDKEVKPLRYFITGSVDDRYVFERDNKYGVIDKNFKIVLDPIYDSIASSGVKSVIIGKSNKRSSLISLDTKETLKTYDEIYPMDSNKNLRIIKNSLHGYLDENLKEFVICNFNGLFPFKNKLAIAYNGKKYGVINSEGRTVVPYLYDEIYLHENGNILVKGSDGYMDFLHRKIIPVDRVYPSLNDYLVYEKNNRFGILDLKDFSLSKKTYDELSPRVEGKYIIVAEKEKYGLGNVKNFEKKVSLNYDYIVPIGKNAFTGGTLDKGLYSLIIPEVAKTEEIYDRIQTIEDKYYLGYRDNFEIDLITNKGDNILTFSPEEVLYFNEEGIVLNKKEFLEFIPMKEGK